MIKNSSFVNLLIHDQDYFMKKDQRKKRFFIGIRTTEIHDVKFCLKYLISEI